MQSGQDLNSRRCVQFLRRAPYVIIIIIIIIAVDVDDNDDDKNILNNRWW